MANNDSPDKKNGDGAEKKKGAELTDTLKKILSAGGPTDISKELLQTVVSNALKAKDDITQKATNEMIALIRRIDFVQEFSKFAREHKFKVTAEIEVFKKDSESAEKKK